MQDWKLEPARDLGLHPGQRLQSLQRESGLISSALHLTWWAFVRVYLAVWHRLTFDGRENIPRKPPFVLVANHASHLDALVLASPLPWRLRDRVFPVAAGDVFFETPMMTTFAAHMLNALPMWRRNCGHHALEQLRTRLLEESCAYILFPEGTRSRDGAMTSFKPGLGMLVAETNVPVVPCHLSGCFEALSAVERWPRPHRISVRIGDPLVFADVTNDRQGWVRIARDTEAQVRRLAGGPA